MTIVAAIGVALIPVLGFAAPAQAADISSSASTGTGTGTGTGTECVHAAMQLEADGESGSYACLVTAPTAAQVKATNSSRVAADTVGCYDTAPVRTIYGVYSSDVVFSIIYGQLNDPVNGSWSNCIDGTFTLGLQTNAHLVMLTAFSLLQNNDIDLSGNLTMEHMNGIFPTNTVDSIGYSNLSGDGFSYSGFLGGTSNGIYAAKMGNMTINDYGRAHTFNLDVDLSTYRFLCQTGEQCNYPDGHEAPVFG